MGLGKVSPLVKGGLLNSNVAGRTDRLPIHVAGDSYIIPADIVSSLGQGNSIAGRDILNSIQRHYNKHLKQHFKEGGVSKPVGIIAAGGEYVMHPETVRAIGQGDMKKGHKHLANFVKRVRAHTINTLKNLPKPKT